jgi:hypothetical protein
MRSRLFLAAILLSSILPCAALAQSTSRVLSQAQPAGASDGPITVTVQYSFALPVKSNDVDSQRTTMEQSRIMLYEMTAKECEMLLATIASSCQLSGLNLHSNVARPGLPGYELMNVSGNAQFKIVLKPKS